MIKKGIMISLEQELDLANSRIVEIEKSIAELQENLYTLADQIKETQRFLVKMAHNQSHMTKRISSWPYIVVERSMDDGDSEV